jgi:hypothetical protein
LGKEVTHCANHWILTILKHKETNTKISLVNIYMPNRYSDKIDCWTSLFAIGDSLGMSSTVVGGDFNTYLSQANKRGRSWVRSPQSEKISNLISDWHLQDIHPQKGKSTWNNRRVGLNHITTYLDRFLINSEFLLSPFIISSSIIPSAISDQKPISLLISPPQNFGPFPFRFNPLWLDSPPVPILVQQAWSSPFNGSPTFVWESKLKAVKLVLKEWDKSTFTPPNKERQSKLSELTEIQKKIENEEVTQETLIGQKEAFQNLHSAMI